MTHHSEPAREAVDRHAHYPVNVAALDASIRDLDAWLKAGVPLSEVENEVAFGESIMLVVHELKRLRVHSASPAPAVGGLEAVQDITGEMMTAGQRYLDKVAFKGTHVLPAQFRWIEFWQAIMDASPAATSQGGYGVREAPTVAKLFGNCDNWGAAEWFERLANAVMEQDKAIAAEDMLSFETYRNIAASSAMELVRGYRTEVRAALAPSTSAATRREPVAIPAGWKLVPLTPTLDMQRAYFDEVDRNMTRVENDYTFGRFDNNRLAYRAMLIAAPPPPAPAESAQVKEARRVRHKQRGSTYEVIGEAEAQVSNGRVVQRPVSRKDDTGLRCSTQLVEGDSLVVYRCEQTGKLWCRRPAEFEDGRFEDIRASLDLCRDEG